MRRAKLFRYWLPAVAWAAILLGASGDVASAPHTEVIVRAVLAATVGPVPEPTFDAIHFALRKAGHVLAYGLAGALNFYAVRGSRRGWMLRWAAIAVSLAAATAAIDEVHQSFSASRTGGPADVVIDVCGAILAQVIWRADVRVRSRRMSASSDL